MTSFRLGSLLLSLITHLSLLNLTKGPLQNTALCYLRTILHTCHFCNTAEYKWLDRTENLESLTLRKTPKMLISFHCKRYSWRFGRICIACFGTQVGAQNYGTYSWLHSLTQKTPLPKPTRNPNNKNYLVIFWWQPGSWTQVTGWGRSGGRRWSDPQEGHPRTALLDC